MGSIPGSERSPGEGNGNPLQHSCLENPMDRGASWATVHGVAKSQTWLKWLSTHRQWMPPGMLPSPGCVSTLCCPACPWMLQPLLVAMPLKVVVVVSMLSGWILPLVGAASSGVISAWVVWRGQMPTPPCPLAERGVLWWALMRSSDVTSDCCRFSLGGGGGGGASVTPLLLV